MLPLLHAACQYTHWCSRSGKQARFAGSVSWNTSGKPRKIHAIDRDRGEFTSVAIDRVDLRVGRSCQRYLSEVFWLQASDVTMTWHFTPDTQQVQVQRFSSLERPTFFLKYGQLKHFGRFPRRFPPFSTGLKKVLLAYRLKQQEEVPSKQSALKSVKVMPYNGIVTVYL